MKKLNQLWPSLTVLMLLSLTLTACSSREEKETTESEDKVEVSSESTKDNKLEIKVVLFDGDKKIEEKSLEVTEDESLLDVMENNFEIEENKGMITSISGLAQDEKENKFWVFTINDEQINVGAKEVTLKAQDEVAFKLETF